MLQVHLPLMRRGFAAEDAWQAFIDVGEVQPCNSTAAPSCTAVTRGIPPLPLICPLTNSMHGVGRLCSCCLLKLFEYNAVAACFITVRQQRCG